MTDTPTPAPVDLTPDYESEPMKNARVQLAQILARSLDWTWVPSSTIPSPEECLQEPVDSILAWLYARGFRGVVLATPTDHHSELLAQLEDNREEHLS